VALPIAFYFCRPKCLVCFWDVTALRTTVPKAAVYKDGQPGATKIKIGLSRNILAMARPTGDTRTDKGHSQPQFCGSIALSSDSAHCLGALCRNGKLSVREQ
jgi:hypothetical protein